MDYISEEINESNIDEWDSFLIKQKYHNIFQSGKLLRALKNSKLYYPSGLLYRCSKNIIRGGFVAYRITYKEGFFAKLTTITIINGGPIVSDEHLSTLLPRITEEILKKSKVDSVYTEIWNMTDQEEVKKHYKQYQYNKHLNYFIKLDDSKSVINRISKRTRRYIRNAGNELTIQQVSSLGELGLLYECLKSTYDRISLPLISKNIFEDLYNSNIGIFLVCYYKNEAIASRVILPFGNEIYDWYGGAKEEYLMHKPNEILINWILK